MKCRFEEFLVGYQDDLTRIIGKYLSKTLHIKVEDVVSVTNQQLLKTKDKFFERFGYDFTRADFGKWAYNYARNLTKWQSIRSFNKDYKLQDGVFHTEEGPKSLFDLVAEQEGEENEELEEFDSQAKIKMIEDVINKYSHLLTSSEKAVFTGLLHGTSELQMSKDQNVTRQAINITKIRVTKKIKAHYNFTVEDISQVSPQEMDDSIEAVLQIINKEELRRLNYHTTTANPNQNLYTYSLD